MQSFWEPVSGRELRQADYLRRCPVAILSPLPDDEQEVTVEEYDLIVMTQSCDLENRDALVVDFREIYSLPFEFLSLHAEKNGPHWRLESPYLEHFSQAFARFFMRVGLPSAIPPYK